MTALHAGAMTPARYREVERILKDWEQEVRANAARFPNRSFNLGVDQTVAFLRMLGLLNNQVDLSPQQVIGPSKRSAVEWQRTYTLHEIDGALGRYIDEIRSALLYGLKADVNPTQAASWMYKATRDAQVNWRTLARTEMVRANAAGRVAAVQAMGYDKVWAPRHAGACAQCRRLLEGKVFTVDEVRGKTNYGKPMSEWVPAIPLHPGCRHVWLPYIPDVFDEAQADYQALRENGLDDDTLNDMFDSSGHVKPKFENDPRLAVYFGETGKILDPYQQVLAGVVEKSQRTVGGIVGKGYFDNAEVGLDPLLWTADERLRSDVRDRIVAWWRYALTDDAPLWSHLYITGSSTSRAWARKTAGDVDVQVVVDYDALRRHHPEYRSMSNPELHAALVTTIKTSLDGVEAAPGLGLDAFIRPQHTHGAFVASVRRQGQGVYDLNNGRWIVEAPEEPAAEDVTGGEFLEGEGGRLALEHPEWLVQARKLRDQMRAAVESGDQVDELRAAYQFVHDLRQREFATGRGADGLGNFLWRYLSDYGPLQQVKHLLPAVN